MAGPNKFLIMIRSGLTFAVGPTMEITDITTTDMIVMMILQKTTNDYTRGKMISARHPWLLLGRDAGAKDMGSNICSRPDKQQHTKYDAATATSIKASPSPEKHFLLLAAAHTHLSTCIIGRS